MPVYRPHKRLFAWKTEDLQGINGELYEVAKREQDREKILAEFLDKTVKMKRTVKEILVLISRGTKERNENKRKSLETKINNKIKELNLLREKHLEDYNNLNDIAPWYFSFKEVEFQVKKNDETTQ